VTSTSAGEEHLASKANRGASAFLIAGFVLLLLVDLQVLTHLCMQSIDHGRIRRAAIALIFFLGDLFPFAYAPFLLFIFTMSILVFLMHRLSLIKT
jgi:hypothetical protein